MKNLDYIMISPENLEEIKQECRMEGAMKERVRINKKRQEIYFLVLVLPMQCLIILLR